MWDSLALPWQATMELVWEAYCDDCLPIAAVVTDADGNILSRGRNRIRGKKSQSRDPRPGNRLFHAEVEALHQLDYESNSPYDCILYTSTEPCPMCMGTFYMSGLRTLHYASRDPYAGSINLLGTTSYLRSKPMKTIGPTSTMLETIIMAFYVEKELHDLNGNVNGHIVLDTWMQVVPKNVTLGTNLYQAQTLRQMRNAHLSIREVLNTLAYQVK